MKLIGMLDSPYVRRCAIAGTMLGITFEHGSISVFRQMDAFGAINPILKAPSLIADDGTVLMDSALILQHFEDIAGKGLRPADPHARLKDLRLTGLAINLCDKAVAVEYERKRPEDVQYDAWKQRITKQLHTALDLIEAENTFEGPLTPGLITAAIGWAFTQFVTPEFVPASNWPKLAAFSKACEATPLFKNWPIDRV
jgi:glutathione S-transferase